MRRSVASCLTLTVLAASMPRLVLADDLPNPDALSGIGAQPNPAALDFAPIDLLSFEAGVGASLGSAEQQRSAELRGRLTLASAALLGLRVEALRVDGIFRPGLHAGAIQAQLLVLDALMLGTRHVDSRMCAGWPGVLCDESTGHVGMSAQLLGVQHDLPSARTALRVGEIDLLGSLSPGFAHTWAQQRLLARAGASLDHFWLTASSANAWRARWVAGVDAAWRVGAIDIQPQLRVRPSFDRFTRDFAVEATLELTRTYRWRGFSAAGDALRLRLQLGYVYWSVPEYAFGLDFTPVGKHGAFLRLMLAPTIFSALPPGGV